FPASATNLNGASGTRPGTTGFDGAEGGLRSPPRSATTTNVYVLPLSRPRTTTWVSPVVAEIAPGSDVTEELIAPGPAPSQDTFASPSRAAARTFAGARRGAAPSGASPGPASDTPASSAPASPPEHAPAIAAERSAKTGTCRMRMSRTGDERPTP